jgi:hypothetical protein
MRINIQLTGTAENTFLELLDKVKADPADVVLDALALYHFLIKENSKINIDNLDALVAEWEKDPEMKRELKVARQWVKDEIRKGDIFRPKNFSDLRFKMSMWQRIRSKLLYIYRRFEMKFRRK